MSEPGVGYSYPPARVSWLKRDVLLFALSIGCTAKELQFLYELHPEFQVFPTYPVILSFKDSTQDVIDFYASEQAVSIPDVPKFDSSRVVDGQRCLKIFKQLPTSSEGKTFEMRKKVVGVYDKGNAGSVLQVQQDLVDIQTNELYAQITVWSFYVGQGNWGGPRGPSMSDIAPPADRKPDAVVKFQTTPETPLLYRLNGDYNPLHATPEPGAAMGFGGVILHGLIAWNISSHAVLSSFGDSKAGNLREFQARFAAPVMPGDRLVIEIWRTGLFDQDGEGEFEELRFVTSVEGGKVALKSGRALVRTRTRSDGGMGSELSKL
ncbi:peroxisomal dehydratase [Phlyctema vagabunda]|uniref:Peroxisomal dehydratase n=1 Tax=Phlyctema vagabunda TaxID=108571 RepID=A0ABR4PKT5_9HELO